MQALSSAKSLVELEHQRTWFWLANYSIKNDPSNASPAKLQGWLTQHWFLTALSQQLAPFRKNEPTLTIFLVFDESEQESYFCEKNDEGYAINREAALNIKRIQLSELAMSRLWLVRDFDQSCSEFAEKRDMTQRRVSLRYGELSLRDDENRHYAYNDQLGLVQI